MKHFLQRVERTNYYHLPIYCCFCGESVYKNEDVTSNPCQHVLFIAADDEFLYLAQRTITQYQALGYNVNNHGQEISITAAPNGDLDKSIDELTDSLQFVDGVKIACYQGAPSFYGLYVGFAPVENEGEEST